MAEIVLALPTFLALLFFAAPYGRHSRPGWGPAIPARVAWLVMESPAPLVFAIVYATAPNRGDAAPLVFLAMWEIHYVYRAFVYPRRIGRNATPLPAGVMLLAITFNVLNAWINARWISAVESYPPSWLATPRFAAGAALFAGGLALNVACDGA